MNSLPQTAKRQGKQSTQTMSKVALKAARRQYLRFHFIQRDGDIWDAPSDSHDNTWHTVNMATRTCACEARGECWHIRSIDELIAERATAEVRRKLLELRAEYGDGLFSQALEGVAS